MSVLSGGQLRKKKWHDRSNHSSYTQVNQWLRAGLLPDEDPDLADEPDPDCAICRFGKAHKKYHKTDTGHIDAKHDAPGEGVSAHQMEAGRPGRIIWTNGLPSQRRYLYVNFWVDHFSRFVYVTMHETKEATELVRSKQEFQDFAARIGVKIKNIRVDNGVYTAKMFQDSCDKNQQRLIFCAVGAHWQDGIAERYIGSSQNMANTILLHGVAYWPGTVTEDMWPFAVRHAV